MINADLSIIGVIAGVVVTAIGTYFTLRLAWKRDAVTKEAGIATSTGDSISRVMQGFSDLNTSLQTENDRVTKRVEGLEAQLKVALAEITTLKLQVAQLSVTSTGG